MKKLFLLSALAAAAASCATVEVADREVKDQEIKFNVSPVTKAASAFELSNIFVSWAWYLPSNVSWDSRSGVAPVGYIAAEEIKYHTDKGYWRGNDSHKWPENGKLTFFSYSLNSNVSNVTSGSISCSSEDGIKAESYDAFVNKNVDFLVADIAKDKTGNESYEGLNGVPTLFRHKLSSVEFKIKLSEDSDVESFTLKNITLKNLSYKGSYTQTSEKWTLEPDKDDVVYYDDATGISITTTAAEVPGEYTIYIPQDLKSAKIEIQYEVATKNASGTVTTTSVTKSAELHGVFADGWKIGKKYVCEISIGFNEILWAPVVDDWALVGAEIITIE